jgi:hypothetical protein
VFKPENKLEEYILKSFNDPSYTPEFFQNLMTSDIYFIIVDERLNNPAKDFKEGDKVNILHIEHDGVSWLPIFSSLKWLQEYAKSDCSYSLLNTKDFFAMCRKANIILNPNFEKSWQFTPEMIEGLLDGSFFKPQRTLSIEKQVDILVKEPDEYPHNLVKALSELFKRNKNVKTAYLVQCYFPESNEPEHPLVGIEVDKDYDKILSEAGLVASRICGGSTVVDFIQIDLDSISGVCRYMVENVKPFFKKRRSGSLLGQD